MGEQATLADGRTVELVRGRDRRLYLIDLKTGHDILTDAPRPIPRTFDEIRADLEQDIGRPFTREERILLRELFVQFVNSE